MRCEFFENWREHSWKSFRLPRRFLKGNSGVLAVEDSSSNTVTRCLAGAGAGSGGHASAWSARLGLQAK